MASAVVRYLAEHPGEADGGANAENTIRHAVEAQWHGDVPDFVENWLAGR